VVRATVRLALWPPGTQEVEPRTVGVRLPTSPVARSRAAGGQVRLAFKATKAGIYYLEAKLVSQSHDPVQYRLALAR
jgi:hypothetical protein